MAFDFSVVVAPFRMQPGLRRLEPGALQLTPNASDCAALREKLAVLSESAYEALVAAPRFDAAAALRALAREAVVEHPDAFACDAAGACTARRLGWSVRGDRVEGEGDPRIGACLRALPEAWRLPGLLCLAFAEDFAVLDAATGRIPWLAVCLPSSWSPQEKVGKSFAEVHSPVADNSSLLAAAPHLLRVVTAGERWERFVWTITNDPRLDHHPRRVPKAGWDATLDPDALARSAFFRTERQTFIPLASLRQAVFTIRVEVEPLRAAVASSDDANRLHAALATMSPAVLAYRGLAPVRDLLLAWLDTRRSGNG